MICNVEGVDVKPDVLDGMASIGTLHCTLFGWGGGDGESGARIRVYNAEMMLSRNSFVVVYCDPSVPNRCTVGWSSV